MIMFAYSVHDGAVNAFLPLFFARSKGEAIRSFSMAVADPSHQFAKSKGDYSLFEIGSFDDVSGKLVADPSRILSALEVATE